ncbi:hypothetical protein [Actinomadura sp. DC4]|nr:hypothetical protein [Actinomadura sp. DC4]MDN3351375.1 hypothetical protein [Actinomadura sp. DC4]
MIPPQSGCVQRASEAGAETGAETGAGAAAGAAGEDGAMPHVSQ